MHTVIVSEGISKEAYNNLVKLKVNIILIKKLNCLYPSIASHADIQCLPLCSKKVIVHPHMRNDTIDELLKNNINVIKGESILMEKYPNNIFYNAAIVGNSVFHNFKYTDLRIKSELIYNNYNLLHVKQGYAKCSVLPIDDKSLITADRGIANVAVKNKFDVLLIEPGHIKLSGLNYGFIGGASGRTQDGIVVFNGSLKYHPQGELIKNFILSKGLEYLELCDDILVDIGSIFFMNSW